ncbi:MAG: hypothetical protein J2P26_02835 [Nocardiopsaceae bacterium]|nr:hypothetical protein [Nocardiopsaceae bacterium]
MPRRTEKPDVMIAIMGAPHASDLVTSALRLTQALLDQGGRVNVWTCGYATTLTQASLGENKPRNVVDWSRDYPSSVTLVRGLLASNAERLAWYVCRFCSAERGAAEQIDQIRFASPFKFGEHVNAAGKALFLGVV